MEHAWTRRYRRPPAARRRRRGPGPPPPDGRVPGARKRRAKRKGEDARGRGRGCWVLCQPRWRWGENGGFLVRREAGQAGGWAWELGVGAGLRLELGLSIDASSISSGAWWHAMRGNSGSRAESTLGRPMYRMGAPARMLRASWRARELRTPAPSHAGGKASVLGCRYVASGPFVPMA